MYRVSRTDDLVVLEIEGMGTVHLTPRKAKKIAKQLMHFAIDVYRYEEAEGAVSEIGK